VYDALGSEGLINAIAGKGSYAGFLQAKAAARGTADSVPFLDKEEACLKYRSSAAVVPV
jgi:hypothetical protein